MPTVSSVIEQIAGNDAKVTSVDFSGQATFQMKPGEKVQQLCDALAGNTTVASLKLKNCSLGNEEAVRLGTMLASNHTITELDLSDNPALKEDGAIAIANGLKTNRTLIELNLMGMPLLGKSEKVLRAFVDLHTENVTLRKTVWRLDHPLANTLAKLVTRNNSIHRRKSQGKLFEDLLPEGMRSNQLPGNDAPAAAAPGPGASSSSDAADSSSLSLSQSNAKGTANAGSESAAAEQSSDTTAAEQTTAN